MSLKKEIKEKGLEQVYLDKELFCIILRDNFDGNTNNFLTPQLFSQQLGYLVYRKGCVIQPHVHRKRVREVIDTHEVVFVRKGKMKLNLYTEAKEHVHAEVLNQGDIVLLCGGGHGFDVLEDTKMVVVKQGPYLGVEEDKDRF